MYINITVNGLKKYNVSFTSLSPAAISHFYEFEDVLSAMNLSFLQSYNLHLLLAVLQNSQLRLSVQQVKHLHTCACAHTFQDSFKARSGLGLYKMFRNMTLDELRGTVLFTFPL